MHRSFRQCLLPAPATLFLTFAISCALLLAVHAQDPAPAPTSPDPAESLAVANAFLDATTIEAKAGYVRDAVRVTPLMQAFYGRQADGPVEPERNPLRPMAALETGGLTCLQYHVPFTNGTNRLLTVVPTAKGPKVDWECYARYNPVGWDALLAGKAPGPAPFRVFLQSGEYYNYQFAEAGKFSAYRLASPDLKQTVFGYVLRDSKLDTLLRAILGTPGAHRVVVDLADDNGSGQHAQVVIKGLVETSWVVIRPIP